MGSKYYKLLQRKLPEFSASRLQTVAMFFKSRQTFGGSFVSAFRGLRFAFGGRNFVVTILIGGFTFGVSYFFGLSTSDRIIIVISTGLILGAEIFNSAFEELLDVLIPHQDPRVGKIKDLLAGGVLIFSIVALIVWGRLFLPRALLIR